MWNKISPGIYLLRLWAPHYDTVFQPQGKIINLKEFIQSDSLEETVKTKEKIYATTAVIA